MNTQLALRQAGNGLFEPLDFIARLAALVPRPRTHLVRHDGFFAPTAHGSAGAAKHRQGLFLQSYCIPAIHGGQMCESGHRSNHKSPSAQYLAKSPICAFDSSIGWPNCKGLMADAYEFARCHHRQAIGPPEESGVPGRIAASVLATALPPISVAQALLDRRQLTAKLFEPALERRDAIAVASLARRCACRRPNLHRFAGSGVDIPA